MDDIKFIKPFNSTQNASYILKCTIQRNGRFSFGEGLVNLLKIDETKFIKIGTVGDIDDASKFHILFKITDKPDNLSFPISKVTYSNYSKTVKYYAYISSAFYSIGIDFRTYRYNFVAEKSDKYPDYYQLKLYKKVERKNPPKFRKLDANLE